MGDERLRATQQRQSELGRDAIAAKLRFAIADPELITEARVDKERSDKQRPWRGLTAPRGAAFLGTFLDDHVIGAELAEFATRVPTLLVWGDADRSVPITIGREAREIVKAARFAVLHVPAHVPHYERPTAFAQVVRAFLAHSELEAEHAHFDSCKTAAGRHDQVLVQRPVVTGVVDVEGEGTK